MLQFIQNYPPAAQIAGDLIAKSMDWPDSDKIAERLKLMLPMPIQQAEAAEEQGQQPPSPQAMQAMAQVQQLQQALQQMGQENQQLKSGMQEKLQVAQMDNQRKMADIASENQRRREDAQAEYQTEIEVAKLKGIAQIEVARIAEQTKLQLASLQTPPPPDPELVAQEQNAAFMQAIMGMAEQMHHAARMAAAPRQHKIIMDGQGNPVGTVSVPMTDGDIPPPPAIDPNAHPLVQATNHLAQQMHAHARVAAAPRQSDVTFDPAGNPIGTTSRPVLQ